ncbi:lipid A biosynthesis acyltransferase [bacterium]|nr:MAG: lipid A biosynthesis acyltransferase [bacterium]
MLETILILFIKASSLLPLRALHGLGAGLGWLLNAFPTEPRQIARINLGLAYPELDRRQLLNMVRKNMIETGKSFAELGYVWFMNDKKLHRLIKEESGKGVYEDAVREGRGLIALPPHLGSWEFLSHYYAQLAPSTCLYRPPKMQKMNKFVLHSRQRMGARMVPTTPSGVKALYRTLAQRGNVGILPDQDPGNEAGVFAPFFGIPANTMTLVARLARKNRTPVIVACAQRLPKGRGYNILARRVSEGIYSEDEVEAASAMNKSLELLVREIPEQYIWSYKRFKRRPDNSVPDYYSKDKMKSA